MALDKLVYRKESSWWQQFTVAPFSTIADSLYARRQHLLSSKPQRASADSRATIVVCISDTHNTQPPLPHGDVLIHAGDLTQNGTAQELQAQLDWLNAQPHEHKVVIAGNHDTILSSAHTAGNGLARARQSIRWGSIIYLENSATDLVLTTKKRLTLFGHPHTQKHGNWAFQYEKGTDVFTGRVPAGTDVLITHSPPQFHLDGAGWGDAYLLREIWRIRPKLHIFGHIHAGAGQDILLYDRFQELYESIRNGDDGAFAVLQMASLLLAMYIGISRLVPGETTLVNASVVGGLLDQNCRPAQVVLL